MGMEIKAVDAPSAGDLVHGHRDHTTDDLVVMRVGPGGYWKRNCTSWSQTYRRHWHRTAVKAEAFEQ